MCIVITICRQQHITCDDDHPSTSTTGDVSSDDTDSESEGGDRSGLFVTRKMADQEKGEEDESFVGLRQSLLEGRIANAALKQPSAPNTYKRITSAAAAGSTFKIHPSSTLHPSKVARERTTRQTDAILFEELVFTTQTFARTVSIIEPAWIQDLATRS